MTRATSSVVSKPHPGFNLKKGDVVISQLTGSVYIITDVMGEFLVSGVAVHHNGGSKVGSHHRGLEVDNLKPFYGTITITVEAE